MTSNTDHEVRANIEFCVNLNFAPTHMLDNFAKRNMHQVLLYISSIQMARSVLKGYS